MYQKLSENIVVPRKTRREYYGPENCSGYKRLDMLVNETRI